MTLKRWATREVIFEYECDNMVKLVEEAVKAGVSLYRADLREADLSYANLREADLREADLSYADLSYANLREADLSYADLRYANLSYAKLRDANLSYANLRYAKLREADLSYADLSYANLRYADLRYANLRYADLRDANLSYAKLRDAKLREAWFNGAVGNMKEIKSLQLEKYTIVYTQDTLQIGCKNYPIEEWKSFTDEYISQMDDGALEWWKRWKEFIFSAIKMTKETK